VLKVLQATIIEPTERSNSPAIISKVAPIPMMPISAENFSQVITARGLKNPGKFISGFQEKIVNNTNTISAPANAPNSGRLNKRLSKLTSRKRSSPIVVCEAAKEITSKKI